MHITITRRTTVVALAAAGLLATVGVGWAAIPSAAGVIHGCYNSNGNSSGQLRVIDREAGAKCAKNEKALDFSQKGPKGDKGDDGHACLPTNPACVGPQGDPGKDGIDGTDGEDGINGTDGTDGAQGPAGVSGHVIVSQNFSDVYAGGQVLCPAGKRVIGGGAELFGGSETSDHRWAIHSSHPVSVVGWFADATHAHRVADEFITSPGLTVYAICAGV